VFAAMLNEAGRSGDKDAVGVQVRGIVESQAPLQQQYQPDHPMADENGYVYLPNVNVVEEMANMISASRSYQTNVEVVNTAKQLMMRTLTMGQ
jgi:flagellar basal-body rod protein FlgC